MKDEVKIIFQNENFLVVDKPSGLVVHGDGRTQENTLVNWLENYCKENEVDSEKQKNIGRPHTLDSGRYVERWGIVNRLDRDTSGLVLIAKNQICFDLQQSLFSTRKIVKKYAALLWGEVNIDEVKRLVDEGKIYQLSRGEILARDIKISDEVQLYLINESLTRHKKDPRIWMCASDEGARQSVRSAETIVSFREVEGSEGFGVSGKKFTKVNFFPLTGRTHQLRLHAKHLGHPILGDTKYGFGGIDNCLDEDKNTRLHLHATSLEFELNGEKYFFESYPSF